MPTIFLYDLVDDPSVVQAHYYRFHCSDRKEGGGFENNYVYLKHNGGGANLFKNAVGPNGDLVYVSEWN